MSIMEQKMQDQIEGALHKQDQQPVEMKKETTKLQIVSVNPAEYGLEEKKATEISNMFKPMLDKMVELETEFNEVSALEISKDACLKAHRLRQKYVKVRTGTAAIHKELKAFYLQGGRFVDGWKNAQLMASQGIEEKLSNIEQHYETLERERIDAIRVSRKAALLKYNPDFIPENLGAMDGGVWDNYIKGVELAYNSAIEEARKIEAERVAKEKAEADERERIRKENEQLRKEAIERDEIAKIEREKREKEDRIRQEKERKSLEIAAEKLRKEREEQAAKLEVERKEKERVQLELNAKKEAEERAERERLAAIESELSKGDSAKVKDLIHDLETSKTKYTFKSKKNKEMYIQVGILLDRIIDGIK